MSQVPAPLPTWVKARCVKSDEGVLYEPWTDGWAVGFRCKAPDGRVEYVYLNPSGGNAYSDEAGNVFLYHGYEGDPAVDFPVTYVDVFKRSRT